MKERRLYIISGSVADPAYSAQNMIIPAVIADFLGPLGIPVGVFPGFELTADRALFRGGLRGVGIMANFLKHVCKY